MAFKDADELFQPWLELPIGGKKYRIPAASIETGIYCQGIVKLGTAARMGAELSPAEISSLKLDDDQERTFNQRLLGTAYEEMLADQVAWEKLCHAAKTAFAWITRDRAAAEAVWNAAAGNRSRPAPQDRRRPAKKVTPGRPAAKKSTASRRNPQ